MTNTRIAWCCAEANNCITLETIADALQDGVDDDTTFGSGTTDGWALLDGGTGDCDNQARLMQYAGNLLGLAGVVRFVRASTNAGAGNCLDLENRVVGGKTQYLIMDFDTGAGYSWNAFEGCCETGGKYYAITPKEKEANDYEMLKEISCQQYWVEIRHWVVDHWESCPPGVPGWQVHVVHEEVAIP